jgi:hypothetical protein
MPKLPIDYSKSVMYKLVCNDLSIPNLYVGSSTDFTRRKAQHKQSCNNCNQKDYNYKVYQVIRENGGWDNWTMVLVENYPCENIHEKLKRERYWLETLKADLNCIVPTRTKKEYISDNKDTIAEKHKQYCVDNREVLIEKRKEYYADNRDIIVEKVKQYRVDNSEKIAEKDKKRYADNRDKIAERRKEKVECPICCKTMRKDYHSKHIKMVH